MSGKGASRWADSAEDTALEAKRKKEKEEKRRLKADKARREAEIQAQVAAGSQRGGAGSDAAQDRPAKRRKVTPSREVQPEREDDADDSEASTKLLRLSGGHFGKARSVENYDRLNDIAEGAYGWVSRAKDMATGKVVAIKKLKIDRKDRSGLPVTGLREIQILKDCDHRNIVKIQEVVVGEDTGKLEK